MKRILGGILATILLLTAMPFQAAAETDVNASQNVSENAQAKDSFLMPDEQQETEISADEIPEPEALEQTGGETGGGREEPLGEGYIQEAPLTGDDANAYYMEEDDRETITQIDSAKKLYMTDFWGGLVAVIDQSDTLWMSEELWDEELQEMTKIMINVADVALSGHNCGAIRKDHSLWMWGWGYEGEGNAYGQIGNGTTEDQDFPVKVMEDVEKFDLFGASSAAIKTDGSLWVWGENTRDILGAGADKDKILTPLKLMENVEKCDFEGENSFVLQKDGTLWGWGNNYGNILNTGTDEEERIHTPVKVMAEVSDFSYEENTLIVIKTDGSVWTSGSGALRGLRWGEQIDAPTKILENGKKVVIGRLGKNAGVLTDNGSLYVWGESIGQSLAEKADEEDKGRYNEILVPQLLLEGIEDFSIADIGGGFLALTKGGTLLTWGLEHTFANGGSTFYWLGRDGRDGDSCSVPTAILENVVQAGYIGQEWGGAAIREDGGFLVWHHGTPRLWGKELENDLPEASEVSTTACLNEGENGGIDGKTDLICDETFFAKDTGDYQHHLARFAAGLSTLVYNGEAECGYIKDALKDLGYTYNEDIETTTKDYEGKTAPYFLASKTVILNGDKTNIVLVVVRGTYEKEWVDNFDSGVNEPTHKGFRNGCNHVYEGLCAYIKDGHLDEGNMKILVTGHSRGAAVANLLGAKLDDQGIPSTSLSEKDIFVYTFASPNTTALGKTEELYRNIYNIVNPEDFVTKVLPSSWGYSRRGITYVLPSRSTDPGYEKKGNHVVYADYLKQLKDQYKKYNPNVKGYEPYKKGMDEVSEYVDYITGIVPSNKQYYTKDLKSYYDTGNPEEKRSLQKLYEGTLGNFQSKNGNLMIKSFSAMVKAVAGYWGAAGRKTLSYFFVNQVLGTIPNEELGTIPPLSSEFERYKDSKLAPYFECAHRPETYLAAMNILTEEELKESRSIKKGIVNCPVDITIKDSSGSVIGQIINNEVVQSSENEIVMDVKGDSKTYTLPEGAEYMVELTGNDRGSMDYSICEVDADIGEVSRIYYQDIPVSQEIIYTHGGTEGGLDSIELKDGNDQIIESSGILKKEEIGQLSVKVQVEGIGSANGFENLSPGDYVSLEAVVDENNSFLGWYDAEGDLVCEDQVFGFSIQKNESFTAKFTDVVVDCSEVQFEKNEIRMNLGETCINTAKALPENATYNSIQYTSSAPEIVQVEDYGLLTAVGEGTATINAESEDGKASSAMTVIVGDASQSYTYELNDDGDTATITKCLLEDVNIGIPSVIDGHTVTGIGDNAFENLKSLQTVAFPQELKEIGQNAFAGCGALTSVILPDTLQSLGNYVFQDCTSLTAAVIDPGRRNITKGLFSGCSSLSSVTMPDSVLYIREDAFRGCTLLKNLDLPESFLAIDENAFLNSGIESIQYAGRKTDWKKITISAVGNTALLNSMVIGSDGNEFFADKNKWNVAETVSSVPNKKVKKITVSGAVKKLAKGKNAALKAAVSPVNALNKKVRWYSSDKKVADVNAKGVVTGKNAGTATITAAAKDGSGVVGRYKITVVRHAVKKITLKCSQKSVKAGRKAKLTAKVFTTGKTANKRLKWSVSNKKYATVNAKGVVTTKKAGRGKKVKVIASATDGSGKKAVLQIRIKK